MNQTAQRFSDCADLFGSILDRASADAPTPCEGWTVTDLVTHVVDTERNFLAERGLDMGERPDFADPATTWRNHASAVITHLEQPGVAETEYDGYFGRTTVADTMADFYCWDLAIHAWDLARASDQPWPVGDAEAERLNATADGFGQALHSEGICGPPLAVADDASPQDHLLARLGRDPHWTPA